MEINITTLKSTVARKNTTLEALAYELGIDRSTLYRRLKKGTAGLTIQDVETISDCLALTPAEQSTIFGGRYVTHM